MRRLFPSKYFAHWILIYANEICCAEPQVAGAQLQIQIGKYYHICRERWKLLLIESTNGHKSIENACDESG